MQDRSPLRVGYHVPKELRNLEVTTTGGGGDNVRYNPYASIERGLERVLGNVFQSAVAVGANSPPSSGPALDYVIVPSVVTNSGGSNFFTWPPETFSVDLAATIRDRDSKVVAVPRVVGSGTATTSERISDHGFSGRRAFEDSLRKLEVALRDWAGSLNRSAGKSGPMSGPVQDRLRQLKDLHDRKLISDEEYELKRRSILSEL